MKSKELIKRYILFIISLFFAALGVAFAKHAELGVSPIASVANVLSCKFDVISLGTWLVIWNSILVLGQVLILRNDFQLTQLWQIPLSFLFGWFTDFGIWILSPIAVDSYYMQISMVLSGIVILAFGIALAVIANVIMNSGEALVKAISDKTHKPFGDVKVFFDVSCVISSILLSLIFFDFSIIGTREGTIMTALLTGIIVKFFVGILKKRLDMMLTS